MSSFWHPLSTILLPDPPCLASTGMLRLLLGAEGTVDLRYAGDRMWPAVRHGSAFRARAHGRAPRGGEVALASVAGVPDLLRVGRREGERLWLHADADPGSIEARMQDVLALAELPARSATASAARARRLLLDAREALRQGPDPKADLATTVRDKYDAQAVHYARVEGVDLDADLEARIREQVASGSSILVVGSGAGKECFALARSGFRVTGVDFSPSMVREAREEAARRGSDVAFEVADIRRFAPPDGSLGAVLFTYSVYSFLPGASERVAVLRRMRTWLGAGGLVYLSARRLESAYAALVLSLQWLSGRRARAEWGDSHTRWIAPDGSLRRSYVHVFTDRALRRETAAAGYRMAGWDGGHAVLAPAPAAIIRREPA